MERVLVVCTDIDGLMQTLNIYHNPLFWLVLIDSSELSLKAFPLHNDNALPSIPVGHSVHNKEPYENMKILMKATNYDKFKWQICGDLNRLPYYFDYNKYSQNIAALFVNGTAEFGLFFTQENIGPPENLGPGIKNVEKQPLVEQSKFLLPSVHLKLGLKKNFKYAMNQGETAFITFEKRSSDQVRQN